MLPLPPSQFTLVSPQISHFSPYATGDGHVLMYVRTWMWGTITIIDSENTSSFRSWHKVYGCSEQWAHSTHTHIPSHTLAVESTAENFHTKFTTKIHTSVSAVGPLLRQHFPHCTSLIHKFAAYTLEHMSEKFIASNQLFITQNHIIFIHRRQCRVHCMRMCAVSLVFPSD